MSPEPSLAPDSSARSPRVMGRALGTLGGVVLGGVLLFGAWAKALDPMAFAEQIRLEGLDFLLPAVAVAFVALALETGLGTALLFGVRRLWVLVPSALLVVFFLFLTGRTYYRDSRGLLEETASCGCFGNLVDRTPAEAFWQDLLLLVPGLILAFLWRYQGPLPSRRLAAVGMITLALMVLAWKSPQLPLDDLATRLKPGVELASICSGSDDTRLCLGTLVPDLEEGEHTVVLAHLDDEAFTRSIDRLNAAALEQQSVWVLSPGTAEEHTAFFWEWGPVFEVVEVPEALIRPLYRTLPRSFEVRDGVVEETYAGVPPWLPEAVADDQPTFLTAEPSAEQ